MKSDEYTDDAICSAMGLGQFARLRADRAIRLLLKPSFHPEVCITLEPPRLHAVALRSMLYHEPVPCRLPEFSETVTLTGEPFDTAVEAFERAFADNTRRGKQITIDGMSVSALLIDGDRRLNFDGHPIGDAQGQLVTSLLRLACASVSSVYLRNRIARCGR